MSAEKHDAERVPLQRLVMPRPVKVRAIQTMQPDGKQGWTAFERIRLGVSAYIVPRGEFELVKREARMFRAMARELSEPWRGKITGLSPQAEELVKRREAKRHNEVAERTALEKLRKKNN